MELLTVQGKGAFVSFCVLLICVIIVCLVKLVRIGYRTFIKRLPPQKPDIPEPEPVYYIVEKKKRPAKTEYAKPKKIKFQEEK